MAELFSKLILGINELRVRSIGIITSGGDAGGLNAVIKGVVMTARALGIKVYVIPNGYAGLYNLIDFDRLTELTEGRVDLINASLAGSEAGHSRVKVEKIADPNKYDRIKQGLEKFGIDALVISGGDNTGEVMVDLAAKGIRCVQAPKTMDLDLQTYSVGADSAINRIAGMVDDLKTTGMSHNRVMVLEVFGRNSGHTAFRGGVAGDADCLLLPEIPMDLDVVYADVKRRFFRRIAASDVKAGTYFIVVAEGVTDATGKVFTDATVKDDAFNLPKLKGAGKYVAAEIQKRMDNDPEVKDLMKVEHMFVPGLCEAPEVRDVLPSHLVRCGRSSGLDVNFGRAAGGAAVMLLAGGITNVTVADVREGVIRYIDTARAIIQRNVDLRQVAFYEAQGFCFGRQPQGYAYQAAEISKDEAIDRPY